jgi:hypothetical protein
MFTMERSKICRVCGRRFAYRPRWKRDWEQVTTCSGSCRKAGVRQLDRDLESAIEALLDRRAPTASICPSEAARQVRPESWRPLMERARRAARRLVHAGRVELVQSGQVVDPSAFRGPVRIRRCRTAEVDC